jgi:hypothetical protein
MKNFFGIDFFENFMFGESCCIQKKIVLMMFNLASDLQGTQKVQQYDFQNKNNLEN